MASSGETPVCLVSFRTAAVFPFSFPFGRKVDLRKAISLNFRPVLGAHEDSLILIPLVFEQRPDLTRGAAWFASKAETAELEKNMSADTIFFPAPLAFAGETDGNGISVLHDAEGSAAVWFEDYEPKLYRYMPDEDGDPADLAQFMKNYASSTGSGAAPEDIRIYEAADLSYADVQLALDKTFAGAHVLTHLDFSNRGASLAERYESLVSSIFNGLKFASAAGIIFLFFSLVILAQNRLSASAFESAPAEIYSLAMGESSRSPLSSITKKLRLLTGGGRQMLFNDVLANIASAWQALPKDSGMKLDAVRYGRERTEVEGQAPQTDKIDKLREELSKNGFSVKLGDVQQIPGSALRFTLYLTEGGRK